MAATLPSASFVMITRSRMRIVPPSTNLASSGRISPLNLLPGNPTMMYSTGPIAMSSPQRWLELHAPPRTLVKVRTERVTGRHPPEGDRRRGGSLGSPLERILSITPDLMARGTVIRDGQICHRHDEVRR